MDSNDKLKEAVATVCEAIRTDEGYKISWVANIAMTFKDEYWKAVQDFGALEQPDQIKIHNIANKAANNFLDLLTWEK